MKVLLASTWFQVCWFAAVIGTYQWQWFTLGFTLVTIAYCALRDAASLKGIAIVTLVGLALDSLNQQFTLLIFPSVWLPVWLLLPLVCLRLVCLPIKISFASFAKNIRINNRWYWRRGELFRWVQTPGR